VKLIDLLLIPEIFKPFKNVVAAQSKRIGGFSQTPYTSLNLGLSTGDNSEDVIKNRVRFFESLAIEEKNVASSGQVHGKEILFAEKAGRYQGYDSIVTKEKNLFVAVSIADCCPVLLYDKKNEVVAAIHAGWRGTVANIVNETLMQMNKKFGANGENIFAFIGACISEKSFEVGKEVAEQFENSFVSKSNTRDKFLVDLKSANLKQLKDFGVQTKNIEVSPFCTVNNNDQYFSYRKEGKESGRMLAIIGMKSSDYLI
jgi:YfiH family protein